MAVLVCGDDVVVVVVVDDVAVAVVVAVTRLAYVGGHMWR